MNRSIKPALLAAIPVFTGACLLAANAAAQAPDTISHPVRSHAGSASSGPVIRIPLTLTGGHDTDPRDRGRPVVLIAAALQVPSEVFRATFRNVRPAPAGSAPDPEQVRRNKDALLQGLSPYGVTNDRLDEVSNFYRYNRSRGEMWRNTPATAYATVRNGKVVGIVVTNPGFGYSSLPTVSAPDLPDLKATAVLAFGTDFSKNGSLKAITLDTATSRAK